MIGLLESVNSGSFVVGIWKSYSTSCINIIFLLTLLCSTVSLVPDWCVFGLVKGCLSRQSFHLDLICQQYVRQLKAILKTAYKVLGQNHFPGLDFLSKSFQILAQIYGKGISLESSAFPSK